jgi:peptidyl-prolyl cis-trans isomerase SDCCAG10
MSNVYNLEPKTTGKVILNTTHGPLIVELWCKECPLASTNFIQLCLEGYYDDSEFHRIVPDFCIQGGLEKDSQQNFKEYCIYEKGYFGYESHSRLKWSRRGLLGMVNHETDKKKY